MQQKPAIVAIVGPTGTGKSALGVELAKRTNGEIISADSMQIYRKMNIGTAKITYPEMQDVIHWGIDLIDPHESFTVADFQLYADRKVNEIVMRNHKPYVVGGTGLYVRSILEDMDFAEVGSDEIFRDRMQEAVDLHGKEWLHHQLLQIDPVSARRLHPNDIKRVIRALEIFHLTGRPMSAMVSMNREKYDVHIIGLTYSDRQLLYERINHRVDQMIASGLIEEVQRLLSSGVTADLYSMQAIGYKEIAEYLLGDTSLSEAIETVKQGTRRFAKRQLSWFRRDPRIHWYEVDQISQKELIQQTLGQVQEFWRSLTNTL